MQEYQVVDVHGTVIRTFQTKNQAEKFKKACKDHGMLGVKVVKK